MFQNNWNIFRSLTFRQFEKPAVLSSTYLKSSGNYFSFLQYFILLADLIIGTCVLFKLEDYNVILSYEKSLPR